MHNANLTRKGDLRPKTLFIMSGALFSMHFGVASMVWPVEWGKNSGSKVWIVFTGVFITVILLTLFAHVALARIENDFISGMRSTLGNSFGNLLLLALITINCPFYGIPMMTAATWPVITQATGYQVDSKLPIIVFNIIFYLVVFLFLIKPSKAMDYIGKILFPATLIIVFLVIATGLTRPLSNETLNPTFSANPFVYGFNSGYATTEILCALIYGFIILKGLQNKGVPNDRIEINTIRITVLAMGVLALTILGNMLLGSHVGLKLQQELSYTALYTEVVFRLIGKVGGILFCVAITFAAMSAAIALSDAAGEFYSKISNGKVSYRTALISTLVASCVISSMGLADMLKIALPILDMLYPATIVFVLHFCFVPKHVCITHMQMVRWAMTVALIFGTMDMLNSYCQMMAGNTLINSFLSFYEMIPFSSAKLTWVLPSAVAYLLPLLFKVKDG